MPSPCRRLPSRNSRESRSFEVFVLFKTVFWVGKAKLFRLNFMAQTNDFNLNQQFKYRRVDKWERNGPEKVAVRLVGKSVACEPKFGIARSNFPAIAWMVTETDVPRVSISRNSRIEIREQNKSVTLVSASRFFIWPSVFVVSTKGLLWPRVLELRILCGTRV